MGKEMTSVQSKIAKVTKISRWSPIWIVPIVTILVGVWVIYSHFADQGKSFTLITSDASGIVAGKTVIKSRSVDVGIIDTVTLSDDFKTVVVQGRIDKSMDELLKNDSVFWVVKPQIDRDGVSGLTTLLSGIYIELVPGSDQSSYQDKPYTLLDSPPLASANAPGIRINLVSEQSGVVSKGTPILFRGFKVGNVETSEFDTTERKMKYQIFIAHPYDSLVTKNVRFWREGGVDFALSPRGASLDIPSLDVLLSGGVSFDVPEDTKFGPPAKSLDVYRLYANKKSIQDSQYTNYTEFLLFFKDSIAGLSEGASVEYRGIRLGTVTEVPYYLPEMDLASTFKYNIPVLIRIEPERLSEALTDKFDLVSALISEQKEGLRAAIKSENLFTGAMYIDLDFYPDQANKTDKAQEKLYGFETIATVPAGLSQIQAKFIQTLDNINKLPLDETVKEMNQMLKDGQKLVNSLNQLVGGKEIQSLPKDVQQTIDRLNETLKGVQPGSDFHNKLNSDLEKFEQVLEELQPLLNTLNDKSNALIFSAPAKQDPQPKAKGN